MLGNVSSVPKYIKLKKYILVEVKDGVKEDKIIRSLAHQSYWDTSKGELKPLTRAASKFS